MTENEIANMIMDAAFQIHRELGPGLLESVYEIILDRKLVDPAEVKKARSRKEEYFRKDTKK